PMSAVTKVVLRYSSSGRRRATPTMDSISGSRVSASSTLVPTLPVAPVMTMRMRRALRTSTAGILSPGGDGASGPSERLAGRLGRLEGERGDELRRARLRQIGERPDGQPEVALGEAHAQLGAERDEVAGHLRVAPPSSGDVERERL